LNPFHAIPVLVDTSTSSLFVLRESRPICRYLALLHSSHANTSTRTLIPKLEDLRGMTRFEEAASLEVTGFDPVANKLVLEQYFKPLFGIEKDEKIVKSLSDQLMTKLDGIDRVLEMREFMSGDVSGGTSFPLVFLFSVRLLLIFKVGIGFGLASNKQNEKRR
jgi:glutathione S-transferase